MEKKIGDKESGKAPLSAPSGAPPRKEQESAMGSGEKPSLTHEKPQETREKVKEPHENPTVVHEIVDEVPVEVHEIPDDPPV